MFNDNSANAEGGIVDGNATFIGCATNAGTVSGAVLSEGPPTLKDCPNYIASDPPLKAAWVTSGRRRRLVVIPSRNWDQFQALGLPIAPLYGPWQNCPEDEACFAYPALYRRFAPFDFVMDYENEPQYLNFPGNPE